MLGAPTTRASGLPGRWPPWGASPKLPAHGLCFGVRLSDMGFEPDVVILDAETSRPLVVFEAKLRVRDRTPAEAQMKAYMQAARCPVGVLATPEMLWLYSDRLRTKSPESVVLVGEYELSGVLDGPSPGRRPDIAHESYAFEAALQDWIEKLASETYRRALPVRLRQAFEEYVVPAFATGEVRAAGPRWRLDDAPTA